MKQICSCHEYNLNNFMVTYSWLLKSNTSFHIFSHEIKKLLDQRRMYTSELIYYQKLYLKRQQISHCSINSYMNLLHYLTQFFAKSLKTLLQHACTSLSFFSLSPLLTHTHTCMHTHTYTYTHTRIHTHTHLNNITKANKDKEVGNTQPTPHSRLS